MHQLSRHFVLTTLLSFYPLIAGAQITPDATLPSNSTVIPQGQNFQIQGGTRIGNNLFHSFQEFSLSTGQTANFNNDLNIQNIFSRVTGGKISNIDGLIQANGSANLFFLNPAGIIFGPNASLHLGGSLIITTANSIKFSDGSFFSATNPTAPPLLTVNVPIGLQIDSNPGAIQVQGNGNNLQYDPNTLATVRTQRPVGLQVPDGNTLALLGGDINLTGGNITAAGGRIELGSVAQGLVTLTPLNSSVPINQGGIVGWKLGYEGITNFQDINLTQGASASSSGISGGQTQVQGRNIIIADGAAILADTLGKYNGGGLIVKGSESVQVTGSSDLFSSSLFASVDPGVTGNGGLLTIETGRLVITNEGIVGADTFGVGNAGGINIKANSVEVSGGSVLEASVYTGATGNGGVLNINTNSLSVLGGSQILNFTRAGGNAGDININANQVNVDGTTQSGSYPSLLSVSVESGATGQGGKLNVTTDSLFITNGARLGGNTSSTGKAGEVNISANLVEVSGFGKKGNLSILSADADQNTGNGGSLTINTGKLLVNNGGQVSTGTFDSGQGGNLIINATNSIDLSGETPVFPLRDRSYFTDSSGQFFPSGLFAGSQGTGNAGSLSIQTPQLSVSNQALISASGFTGKGGSLLVQAPNLTLDNGGKLSVRSQGTGATGNLQVIANTVKFNHQSGIEGTSITGEGANLSLSADTIQLRNNSFISATAGTQGGPGNGGNINITTNTLGLLEKSNIVANAFSGKGGNITITTQGDFLSPDSEITASSQLGLNGVVDIRTPGIDPSKGLVNLPQNFTNVSKLISSTCDRTQSNQFTITGKGGLPPNPGQTIVGTAIWQDLRSLRGKQNHNYAQVNYQFDVPLAKHFAPPILEANGWIIDQEGKVKLVTHIPQENSQNGWYHSVPCRGS